MNSSKSDYMSSFAEKLDAEVEKQKPKKRTRLAALAMKSSKSRGQENER